MVVVTNLLVLCHRRVKLYWLYDHIRKWNVVVVTDLLVQCHNYLDYINL